MGLSELFRQRAIRRKHTSIRAHIPLKSPSGPQETESQLETDLVLQLQFSVRVYDLITQPIIDYVDTNGRPRQYTPDVFVELYPDAEGDLRYYMIEAKMADALRENWNDYQMAFDAARAWCADHHAHFRIVTEEEIRTPYLTNAKMLSEHLDLDPDDDALDVLWQLTDTRPTTVSAALSAMREAGLAEPKARTAIERAVANRFVACDLGLPFSDDTQLFNAPDLTERNSGDPLLEKINLSPWR